MCLGYPPLLFRKHVLMFEWRLPGPAAVAATVWGIRSGHLAFEQGLISKDFSSILTNLNNKSITSWSDKAGMRGVESLPAWRCAPQRR
jgi:hypothetical protein